MGSPNLNLVRSIVAAWGRGAIKTVRTQMLVGLHRADAVRANGVGGPRIYTTEIPYILTE